MDFQNNNIIKVTDSDFGIKEKNNREKPAIRMGARGIVLDDNGNIAIINKQKKNEYKLLGGGIDRDEKPDEAFKRECEEELGAKVEIKKLIGTAEEYKSQENFKQISYIFVANKIKDLESNNLTQKEKDEGTRYLWMNFNDALTKMKESLEVLKSSEYDNLYRTKFMVLRDIKILEYYISSIKN